MKINQIKKIKDSSIFKRYNDKFKWFLLQCLSDKSDLEFLDAIKKGFKIYNHECFTAFLKEFMDLDSESIDFDNFRKIRNSINYYGEDITIEDAESLISKIRLLRKKLIKEFL